jgi:hypothetical protein
MISRRKLKKQIEALKAERHDILYYKHSGISVDMAMIAISDLEFKIASLEDQLNFENRMIPFTIMLYGFIAVGIVLVLWTMLFSNN